MRGSQNPRRPEPTANKDLESLRTRERILAAARELFAEQGYTAASISKIAKKADVLPGSLYWAFESKERLFAAVLTAASEEWIRKYLPAANDEPTGLSDIRKGVLVFASGFAEGPEFLRLMMVVATEHQAGSPEIREAAIAIRRFWRDRMEGSLMEALSPYEAEGARALAQRMGRLTLQLLDGVFMSLQIERTELTPEELFADVADVLARELEFGIGRLRKTA